MSNKKCTKCIFGDKCYCLDDCKYYTPLQDLDDEIDQYIEIGRSEFYEAWEQYIAEW